MGIALPWPQYADIMPASAPKRQGMCTGRHRRLNMPAKSAHLTAEELDYLRELFAADQSCEAPPTSSYQLLLDPSGTPNAQLLLQLINADRLQLTAEQGNYVFDFELYVERRSAGLPMAVRFNYPTIIERYGTERAARVHSYQGDIQVADSQGLLQNPRVRDISVTGLSLTDLPSILTRPGRRPIQLHLELAEAEQLDLKGRVVRVNRDQANGKRRTLGIRFENIDPAARAILNRYIFHHHSRAQH